MGQNQPDPEGKQHFLSFTISIHGNILQVGWSIFSFYLLPTLTFNIPTKYAFPLSGEFQRTQGSNASHLCIPETFLMVKVVISQVAGSTWCS